MLGLDRRYRLELVKQSGYSGPLGPILEMNAERMTFPDASFDFVLSVSVFEHLPDIVSVITEIRRVLRPGCIAAIITHIYTSDSGIHDPRLFGDRFGLPYWSHLRPGLQHNVSRNSYLNELRLDEYRAAFKAEWPGAVFENFAAGTAERAALSDIRAGGELADYSEEELLTNALFTLWRKPGSSSTDGTTA